MLSMPPALLCSARADMACQTECRPWKQWYFFGHGQLVTAYSTSSRNGSFLDKPMLTDPGHAAPALRFFVAV